MSHCKKVIFTMCFPHTPVYSTQDRMPFLDNQNSLIYLGQCKAQPFKFNCAYFCFSALTDNPFSGVTAEPMALGSFCVLLTPMAKVHCPPPPMNKFAFKLHGYIVYFPYEFRPFFVTHPG